MVESREVVNDTGKAEFPVVTQRGHLPGFPQLTLSKVESLGGPCKAKTRAQGSLRTAGPPGGLSPTDMGLGPWDRPLREVPCSTAPPRRFAC